MGRPALGDPRLFAEWDPPGAWLAGLVWADGCLTVDARHARWRRIRLAITDEEIAQAAARIAGVSVSEEAIPPLGTKPVYVIRIGHYDVVRRMQRLGLVQRKSLVCPPPEGLPQGVVASFVRGYFDGNGTVGLYRNPSVKSKTAPPRLMSGFDGSRMLMDWLQDLLAERAGIARRKVLPNQTIWRLRYNHADSLRLAALLYSQDGPSLSRKRELFELGAQQPWYGPRPATWPVPFGRRPAPRFLPALKDMASTP